MSSYWTALLRVGVLVIQPQLWIWSHGQKVQTEREWGSVWDGERGCVWCYYRCTYSSQNEAPHGLIKMQLWRKTNIKDSEYKDITLSTKLIKLITIYTLFTVKVSKSKELFDTSVLQIVTRFLFFQKRLEVIWK